MFVLKYKFLKLFFFFCLILFSADSFCQSYEYLVIEKPGTSKRYVFTRGDLIKLKTTGESVHLSGKIELLLDSSLVVDGHSIKLTEIAQIKINRSGEFMPKIISLSYKLPIAGILLMLFEGISSELQNESPLVEENTMVIAGSLIAGGILLRNVVHNNIKLNGKYRARIVKIELK